MSTTTLALTTSTAASVIDFGAGASEVDFANSSALNWTGAILNLLNWDPSIDKLRFGTDATGLTSAQLATIEFNGSGLGSAQLNANGYVVVPEPSTALLLLVGGHRLIEISNGSWNFFWIRAVRDRPAIVQAIGRPSTRARRRCPEGQSFSRRNDGHRTGLANLKGLAQLQYLYLNKTNVGDAGLASLNGLTQLRTLGLSKSKTSDAGAPVSC
jgi:hypothetical protein